ncbi:branched-chain amino acid ABC transporter permease [Heliobacterium gestii]|uniref:Branched-chain amino acid ABC transporter permease n=1 Tax=Heliomicrobium gestii TaxID=2699 RepID=A0A845LHT7_HELGE|nr:AzlC family ABC transporter permease [Heliomicrobium gestii]MBM7868366.1 4-azaleucine resistance transporter AzlC [Heliomicrobium gestii]MZP42426.1 branched-chain amino acid ABC transporter permease [Heliomicrobium gestii]
MPSLNRHTRPEATLVEPRHGGVSADIRRGVTAGIPIAIGYVPIAIAFGLLAKSSGLPNWVGMAMSFFVFAGASQFVGVNLLVLGAGFGEIVLTTLILNFRHFLMSAALSQRLETNVTKKWLALIAFGVTDETFGVSALRSEAKLAKGFVLGLNVIAYTAWNAGTWIGLFIAEGLPEALKNSMGIALYAMFIGLLLPSMKRSREVMTIALLAAAIHALLRWLPIFAGLSAGWTIIIATVLSAAAGAAIFTKEANRS